jgi:flagellar protein FliO/FliZ
MRLTSHPQILATLLLLSPLSAASPSAPVAVGQALQVVLGLCLVLGMIVAAAWAARRLQAIRPQGSGHIRVIEGMALGTRDKLLLVEVDGARVLLGLSAGRIATLYSFNATVTPRFDEALRAASASPVGEPS